MPRQHFVTTALPYANGNFHIGHIMEYIQADIWVRFQRMQGHQVDFVCADDAHGAPIMIAAEKAGKTPQQFVADIAAGRAEYLQGFHIEFDNWHSTDAPENHALARQIYLDLRDRADGSLIETRSVEQFFDPEKNMFLPDRFIKGECPNCHAKDQYGDNCEVCGAVYAPTDLIKPYSALSGVTPVLRSSEHFFFKLSDPRDERIRRDAFGLRLEHDRRAVSIVRAHEVHLVALHALEAHPDVGLDVLHDVADVERAVGVRQGGGDKKSPFEDRKSVV